MEGHNTINFFEKFFKYIRVIGVGDFWVTKDEWRINYEKLHTFAVILTNLLIVVLILLECGGVCLDTLDEKQKIDNIIFIWAHNIFLSYIISVWKNKKGIKKLIIKQCFVLPKLLKNEQIEIDMIKSVKMYSVAAFLLITSTLIFYGIAGLVKVKNGE